MDDEVLEFIYRRFQGDSDWLTRNSYYFAMILCHRFPDLNMYYAPVLGHFTAGKNGRFYDWCGEFTDETPVLLKDIIDNEADLYARLVEQKIL